MFRVLRDPVKGKELTRLLELTPYAMQEYEDCYLEPLNDVDDARQMICRSFLGIGSDSIFRRNGFRRGFKNGKLDSNNAFMSYLDCIPFFIERMRPVIIENMDWSRVIRTYDTEQTLFFVDPPYLDEVCSSRAVTYSHPFTREQHLELANVLNQVKGNVILSGYRSDLYESLFSSWTSYAHSAVTGMGRKRAEMIWIKSQDKKLF
ncbi:DNA adenine methylase [Gammaproteobacteria bacterium]